MLWLLQALRRKIAELLSDQAHDDCNDLSQTPASRFPRWDATETLLWFGTTFPFSDLYVDKFAELDIDAASLRNLSDSELREELQVRSQLKRSSDTNGCTRS
jgi:hypothetical protein